MTAEDWRLRGQDLYLADVELRRRPYRRWRDDWAHDHCEFCWREFVEEGAVGHEDDSPPPLTEGYATTESAPQGAEYHWICAECFGDFEARFGWRVVD